MEQKNCVGVKIFRDMLRWLGHVEKMFETMSETLTKQIYNANVECSSPREAKHTH